MSSWARTTCLCSLALCLSPGVLQAERVNPFSRALQTLATPTSTSTPRVSTKRNSHPRLRGVLHSADGSLVNLDGVILAEQESARGYRLLTVQEHSAVFEYRGRRVTLAVSDSTTTRKLP